MKRKVLFLIPSLHSGGAERVITTILKYIDRQKFEVSLAVVSLAGQLLDQIPKDINVIDLKAVRVRYAIVPIMKAVWRIKPDVVFSTLGHLNIIVLMSRFLFPKGTIVIVREATLVSEMLKVIKLKTMWKALYTYYYKKADYIICQSAGMKIDLIKWYAIPEHKIRVIYNPVDIFKAKESMQLNINPFSKNRNNVNIVTVGRLSPEKGYDRLIRSFKEFLAVQQNAMLWILGEGELASQLKSLTKKLAIDHSVKFLGFQKNPYHWYQFADLFILASYYEGLPNVVLEAIACGCPVIVIDHPGGTKEIMELTGQSDRIVNELTWEDSWFDKPEAMLLVQLEQNFGVLKIVKQYEYILQDKG